MPWRPLSARSESDSIEEYDALHEGVPTWLRAGVVTFLRDVLQNVEYGQDADELLRIVEQLLRLPLEWGRDPLGTLLAEVVNDRPKALDIVDAALMLTQGRSGGHRLGERLEVALRIGGSAWKVAETADGTPCLERRVDATTESAAKEEMGQTGNAARHLRLAWHKVYGRQTDSSGAFREAVRAVEAAAKPVIIPKDPLATLGKMIIAMRDKPSKWTSDLGTVPQVVEMMGQLWTSQLDRHGTDDETVRLSVSVQEAEAAVHLAVLLVHWFRNGHIKAI